MTAAHWAAYNKDFAVVRELLDNGADHFVFSHMGRLPIDVGGSSRAWDVVDICLNSYYNKVTNRTSLQQNQQDQPLESIPNEDKFDENPSMTNPNRNLNHVDEENKKNPEEQHEPLIENSNNFSDQQQMRQ